MPAVFLMTFTFTSRILDGPLTIYLAAAPTTSMGFAFATFAPYYCFTIQVTAAPTTSMGFAFATTAPD